jgi:hypothetical protein
MNLFKRIQSLIPTDYSTVLFEIREGDHSRFISFDEWYRERKENVFINKFGHYGSAEQLLRIHSIKSERKIQ